MFQASVYNVTKFNIPLWAFPSFLNCTNGVKSCKVSQINVTFFCIAPFELKKFPTHNFQLACSLKFQHIFYPWFEKLILPKAILLVKLFIKVRTWIQKLFCWSLWQIPLLYRKCLPVNFNFSNKYPLKPTTLLETEKILTNLTCLLKVLQYKMSEKKLLY